MRRNYNISPMRHWGVTKGKKVGVVGLGGLGHMAVKFAHALGAHVVVFTTSPKKKEDALRLGADEVIISRNTDQMNNIKAASTLSSTRSLQSTISTHTYNYSAVMATSPSSAHQTSLMPSRPLALYPSDSASQARPSEVLPKRRRCSTFAANITSLPT